jgi:hypothetical protein
MNVDKDLGAAAWFTPIKSAMDYVNNKGEDFLNKYVVRYSKKVINS